MEQAIKITRDNCADNLQLSVLGKLGEMYLDDDKKLVSSKVGLKTYWKEVLGPNQQSFHING
ncbi:MAG: hypothetical protein KAJ23_14275 [Maribacter sp.]|nr:hypothetical protein [Maribacter sp.]